jgi:hypothetical protein
MLKRNHATRVFSRAHCLRRIASDAKGSRQKHPKYQKGSSRNRSCSVADFDQKCQTALKSVRRSSNSETTSWAFAIHFSQEKESNHAVPDPDSEREQHQLPEQFVVIPQGIERRAVCSTRRIYLEVQG